MYFDDGLAERASDRSQIVSTTSRRERQMTVVTSCRICGSEIEAGHDRIVAGQWRVCVECESRRRLPEHPTGGKCGKCNRPLRDPRRHLCLSCSGFSVS